MAGQFIFMGNDAIGRAVDAGMRCAGWTRAADVSDAQTVFTYFSTETSIEDAYFETDGLVKRARKGTLLVDLSPSTPAFARELSAVATVNDLLFVEAPLVVMQPARRDALAAEALQCFVAAESAEALEQAESLVKTFAATVLRTGSCGSAQLAKSACTAQMAAQVLAAAESYALYTASGAAARAAAVPACSPLADQIVQAIAQGQLDSDYSVEMMFGEVGAAMTVADDENLILPQLEATMHLLEVLEVIGGADRGVAAVSLMYLDEKASAEQGLDWTRAAGLFADGHDHAGHGEQGDYADYDDDMDDGFYFDDYQNPGNPFGFGTYSKN